MFVVGEEGSEEVVEINDTPPGDDDTNNGDPPLSSSEGTSPVSTFRLDLIPFARNCETLEDYELLKEYLVNPSISNYTLQNSSNEEARIHDDAKIQTTLLHATLQSSQRNSIVPLDLIHCMVDLGGTDMVEFQDSDLQTPLHHAISELPRRIDIIRYLLRQAPKNVFKENNLHLRPIDLMSQQIMMGEEGMKYDLDLEPHYLKDECDPMWETVDLLVKASADPENYESLSMPLLHSCLICKDVPYALMHRVIRQFSNQLSIRNDDGDLPLHLVASRPPGEADTFDDVGDLFSLMLTKYPGASTVLNAKGLSPLAVAVRNGHSWQSRVVTGFLSKTPASLGTLIVAPKVLPYLLQRLKAHAAVFELLRANPPL